jgi:hypothetical protein
MKKLLLAFLLFSTSMEVLAQPMDVTCQMNTPCEMHILGLFNKIVHTYDIEANETYVCKVLSHNGNLFSIHNVQTSPGVYLTHSATLETPFKIIGSTKEMGSATYTVHNNDFDIFKFETLKYKCAENK